MADCLVQAYSNPAIIISKILGGGRIMNEKTVSQKGQKEIRLNFWEKGKKRRGMK